jgi:hypothetical protein
MRPRIPTDAFDRYVALGAERTYAALAEQLGVSKRTIVRHAIADRWQERLAQVEREGRAKAEARLTESVAAVTERHLRTLRAVQHKALQALANAGMGTAAQAAATLIAAVRAERAIIAPADGQSAPGRSWAEIVEASFKVTPQRIEEVKGIMYQQMGLPAPAAAPAPASQPEAAKADPPALAPRVSGEN